MDCDNILYISCVTSLCALSACIDCVHGAMPRGYAHLTCMHTRTLAAVGDARLMLWRCRPPCHRLAQVYDVRIHVRARDARACSTGPRGGSRDSSGRVLDEATQDAAAPDSGGHGSRIAQGGDDEPLSRAQQGPPSTAASSSSSTATPSELDTAVDEVVDRALDRAWQRLKRDLKKELPPEQVLRCIPASRFRPFAVAPNAVCHLQQSWAVGSPNC